MAISILPQVDSIAFPCADTAVAAIDRLVERAVREAANDTDRGWRLRRMIDAGIFDAAAMPIAALCESWAPAALAEILERARRTLAQSAAAPRLH